MTPSSAGAVSRLMQAIGRRYIGSFNARCRRTGTLWEGRIKAALLDSERYLMACYRGVELNPVRAGMTNAPADYPCSSYTHNAWGQQHPLITPHQEYLNLGSDPVARQTAYRELIREHLDEPQLNDLRQHTQQQRAKGSERSRQQIEALTQRATGIRPRGRPRKPPDTSEK